MNDVNGKKAFRTCPGILLFVIIFTMQITAQSKTDFTVRLINDEKIKLSSIYSNGPVLVNFWALWCKPCRTEMKALKELYEKYSPDGFSILGINQDSPRSSGKVKSFIKSLGIKYPIGLDPNNEYSDLFNVQSLPFSLLIDKNGIIVSRHIGYLPGDEFKLEAEIKTLIYGK
ncbi:MAG: TlpA family protein disulfide reductase [Ignavibacteriae bacterium HGW-Ignavibacteriae-3]|nr:MAG: TlpA family protein disulfide reductase [Ignavibacteriae bacterium HGW-Ignavibacteriae-3]